MVSDDSPNAAPLTDLPAGGANRLLSETSPYLLQHAHNPVDWYPWGPDAIAAARRDGKPLFVSIGYATCYWCHVMERESFEDPATAALLNRLFVPVKVDREQRPDIDDVYMTACQVFTQLTEGRASGGWPLSVFLDPHSLKPFYVGTYFPPRPSYGRPSFSQLLEALSSAWHDRRDEVSAQADRIADLVRADMDSVPEAASLGREVVTSAVGALLRFYDAKQGGFGGAPKFPQPAYLELLERRLDTPAASEALSRTLDRMAVGGIFDQLGGGFHRYAVDAVWLVPHFEKMLYDNAQLAPLYARSFARTGDSFHAEVARRTCTYVLREMTDVDGVFYSAQDAEVEAREGGSYIWTSAEIEAALKNAGASDLIPFALALYGVDAGPNFQDPHHADAPPANVLFLADRPDRLAAKFGLDDATFATRRERVRSTLLNARSARRQPMTDDKALTAWNGLMIAALAECGTLLKAPEFVAAAERAARAIDLRARAADGSLQRSSRAGRTAVPAFLDDYAALCRGRLALFRATQNDEHRIAAAKLFEVAVAEFSDPRGGYFDVREGQNELFVRGRSLSDGAVPSGNSIMLLNALDLWAATKDVRYRDELTRNFRGLSGALREQTIASALGAVAVDRASSELPEVLPTHDGISATKIIASIERVTVDATSGVVAGVFVLALPATWHVYASGHPENAVEPLSLHLLHADASARLEPDYPAGEVWRDGARILTGRITIPFLVRGLTTDRLGIEASIQPCDERVCFRPQRVAANVTLPRRD